MTSEPKTALITGASSGIGAAFAARLAADGYDLALVARRREKLQTLADGLHAKHNVAVEIVIADLANSGDVERVEQLIAWRSSMAMLVNNAGFGTVGHFHEVDLAKHLDMVHVHVNATVRFSHAALSNMLPRKRGAIINVSSLSAYLAMPNAVTYTGTKMFLITFSEALAKELDGTGVHVQVLCPGFTYTEFHDTSEFKSFNRSDISSGLWMSADDVVSESMLALERNRVICIPGRKNRFLISLQHSPLGPILKKMLVRKRYQDREQ